MLRPITALALAWAISMPAADPPPAAAPAPLTAEELFRAAPLGDAALSPDGLHLGTIVSDDKDRKNLLIFNISDFKPSGLRGSGSFEISTFRWLGNDRVVFNVLREKLYSWGLYTGRIDRMEDFSPIDRFDVTDIIGVPRARPGRAIVWIRQAMRDQGRPGPLVELNAERYFSASDVFNHDTVMLGRSVSGAGPGENEAVTRTYSPPKVGVVMSYKADQDGELALCWTWLNGRTHLFHFLAASNAWREVALAQGVRWMEVDPDNRFLWVVTHSVERG
jgi:hypothetical protein